MVFQKKFSLIITSLLNQKLTDERAVFMTLGQKLKKRREELGFTQPELAEKTNLKQNYISRVENNKFEPTATAIVTLAKALGMSADELLGMNEVNKTC